MFNDAIKIFGYLISLAFIIIVIVSVVGEYCPEEEAIKIGAIQALTGKAATFGLSVQEGMDLALEDINSNNGINGKKLEILYEDASCEPVKGVSAARKLIEFNDVSVILGATCSSVSMAIAPIAEESKIIMLTSVSSVPSLKDAGDYIFRNRIPGGPHGVKVAEFSFNNLSARKAAVLYINLDNGVGYRDAFVERFEELGGEITNLEAYEKELDDFRTQLLKIKENNPDVIFLAGQGSEGAVKQTQEMNIDIQIVGPVTIETSELVPVAGEAAEGIFYSYSAFDPESSNPVVAEYQEKYFVKYGKLSDAFAANGYDATMLIANALRLCGENPDCVRDYLYSTENYPGVGGLTTFDEFGEVDKPLIIKTIKNGEFVFYSN